MKDISQPFENGVPSLFIVQTPFQAMCAINAIKQLKIDEYTLTLHLHKNTEKRNKQTIEIVERYGLNYKVANTSAISFIILLSLLFKRCSKQYQRVFLGTHLYHDGYYYALKEINDGGNIVLLDDGVATLSLLESGYGFKGRSIIFMLLIKFVALLHRIKINNVFTVYKGITNQEWNIAFNDISFLRKDISFANNETVLFIGTNNSGYITRYGVNESDFKQMLYNVLKRIKLLYPDVNIMYIPHGLDKSTFAKDFCDEIGIEYKPLDVNVEVYILSMGIIPRVVYGFTSSALYNLKMIFPEIEVNNILTPLLTDPVPDILDISGYYEKHGIPTLNV